MLSCVLLLHLIKLQNILTFTSPLIIPLRNSNNRKQHFTIISSTKHVTDNDNDSNDQENNNENNKWEPLEKSMQELNISKSILTKFQSIGFQDSNQIQNFAFDFRDRPEMLSSVLQKDFAFPTLESHFARAAILHMINSSSPPSSSSSSSQNTKNVCLDDKNSNKNLNGATMQILNAKNTTVSFSSKPFKSFIIDERAKKRRSTLNESSLAYDYGLSSNTIQEKYPTLHIELEDFYTFMTTPVPNNPEPPIAKATADTYFRHAKLFLGWYIQDLSQNNTCTNNNDTNNNIISNNNNSAISIYNVIKGHEKRSDALIILKFITWLRIVRKCSCSYEANIIRGLLKLIKFRFSHEIVFDNDDKPFDNLQIIKEVRKYHRNANSKKLQPSLSKQEQTKWISWEEYLQVITKLQMELQLLLHQKEEKIKIQLNNNSTNATNRVVAATAALDRKIAIMYQYFLITSIFSNVPDRQRTIRELELGTTLQKCNNNNDNCFVIQHSAQDYKTGKIYGSRPPLPLSTKLSTYIQDFIDNYRLILKPTTNKLFVMPRTARPLTQDSVYQIVSRMCYKYTGKRTNPHLLRDMIVTHVKRKADVGEKELEALALLMGHSVNMQRSSYDRRTISEKIAPAVELLKSVNNDEMNV